MHMLPTPFQLSYTFYMHGAYYFFLILCFSQDAFFQERYSTSVRRTIRRYIPCTQLQCVPFFGEFFYIPIQCATQERYIWLTTYAWCDNVTNDVVLTCNTKIGYTLFTPFLSNAEPEGQCYTQPRRRTCVTYMYYVGYAATVLHKRTSCSTTTKLGDTVSRVYTHTPTRMMLSFYGMYTFVNTYTRYVILINVI